MPKATERKARLLTMKKRCDEILSRFRIRLKILQSIKHACIYTDDIRGTRKAEHLNNLDQVPSRLENAGIRLKHNT